MEKLELKDLSPYLPYGLKIIYTDKDNEIYTLVGLKSPYKTIDKCFLTAELRMVNSTRICSHVFNIVRPEVDCKPLLFPLSHLTKPITVGGETFVPIEKLAEVTFSEFKWGTIGVATSIDSELTRYFEYEKGTFKFWTRKGSFEVPNQLHLFQMLYKWHFDIHDLISRNLAIDKSLNNN